LQKSAKVGQAFNASLEDQSWASPLLLNLTRQSQYFFNNHACYQHCLNFIVDHQRIQDLFASFPHITSQNGGCHGKDTPFQYK
jgi:hypothetical protein